MEQWNLSPRRVLRVLFWLRVISIGLQGGLILLTLYWPLAGVNHWALFTALVVLTLFNLLVHWRLRRGWPATEVEVTGHLLFDVTQFTVVLYFTGGAANPFISIYLLPVVLAAATLNLRFGVLIGLACTVAYSILLALHGRSPMPAHQFSQNFQLHIWGMWLNFLLASVLLICFVGLLARIVRRRDREIAAARERTLRDEGILAVGTLAAGAAHQLGTPLSTMNVLLEDWLDDDCRNIQRDDVVLLVQQVGTCREILHQLLQQVRQSQGEANHRTTVHDFLETSLERWRVTRPDIRLAVEPHPEYGTQGLREYWIRYDVTLAQALTNLLNNAADASLSNHSHQITLTAWVDGRQLQCQIRDHGRGLDANQAMAAQQMFRSAKAGGMGIGLALSNSTIERLRGNVRFYHDREGGVTWVQVPLTALAARPETTDATADC